MKKTLQIILTLFFALGAANAQTAIPKLVNYQGRLTDGAGQPLTNGVYKIKFELFDSQSAATNLVWGATNTVTVISGQFNVVLGSGGSPVSGAAVNDIGFAFGGGDRFLQMTILTDATGSNNIAPLTLSPRQQILSAPYAITALHGVPPGTVVAFAGTNVPAGWRLCDGSPINASTNSAYLGLFAVIGKTYGVGDGTAFGFNLPDMRSRTVIGAGQGAGIDDVGRPLSNRAIGQKMGEEIHNLSIPEMPSHTHAVNDPGHSHVQRYRGGGPGSTVAPQTLNEAGGFVNTSVSTATSTTDVTLDSTGGSASHNNMQPSLVLSYIIKL